MKILDILCEMLFYPFMTRMVELDGIYHNLLILDIFKYCYRLIKHIIREYRPNELYGSQWLNLMMMHAMNCEDENDIEAEPTLTELIDNNTDVLENRIQQGTIIRFIDALLGDDK
jgi:hypothetical protein